MPVTDLGTADDFDLEPVNHDPFARPNQEQEGAPDPSGPSSAGRAPMADADRDAMIKTIAGEASGQPPLGQAAVAHVILNRVADGGYGEGIQGVVKAPTKPGSKFHEFSVWNPPGTRESSAITHSLKSDDPEYAAIGGIVDKVYGGLIPDPTNGATHYYALRSMPGHHPPPWAPALAAQNQVRIGDQFFVGGSGGTGQTMPGQITGGMYDVGASGAWTGGRVGYQDGGAAAPDWTDPRSVAPDQSLPPYVTAPPGPPPPPLHGGASPILRDRALGAQMIAANDPSYPAGFAQLYNTGVRTSAHSDDPFGPVFDKMTQLGLQKQIYDRGLGSLPPDVAWNIVTKPSAAEGQRPPSTRPPADEPFAPYGRPEDPQIGDIRRLFGDRSRAQADRADPALARTERDLMKLPGFSGFSGGPDIWTGGRVGRQDGGDVDRVASGGLSPTVQRYIHSHPSYEEGERPPPDWSGGGPGVGPPQPRDPQIGDIKRLFRGRILGNPPPYDLATGGRIGYADGGDVDPSAGISQEDLDSAMYGAPVGSGNANAPDQLAGLSPQLQEYIRTHPSQSEGQRAWWEGRSIEPDQPLHPQIGDIQRLFRDRIQSNAPTSEPRQAWTDWPLSQKLYETGHLAGGYDLEAGGRVGYQSGGDVDLEPVGHDPFAQIDQMVQQSNATTQAGIAARTAAALGDQGIRTTAPILEGGQRYGPVARGTMDQPPEDQQYYGGEWGAAAERAYQKAAGAVGSAFDWAGEKLEHGVARGAKAVGVPNPELLGRDIRAMAESPMLMEGIGAGPGSAEEARGAGAYQERAGAPPEGVPGEDPRGGVRGGVGSGRPADSAFGARPVAAAAGADVAGGATGVHLAGPDVFHAAITEAKAAHPDGAQLALYPPEDYAGMSTYMTADGRAGAAVKPDGDIVSVFRHPAAPKGASKELFAAALAGGGRKLDAFDTYLPDVYARQGFRPVARMPFDPAYAPPTWDYERNLAYNNGRPDVVYMVHDPENASASGGKTVSTYEEAVAEQRKALDAIDARAGPDQSTRASVQNVDGVLRHVDPDFPEGRIGTSAPWSVDAASPHANNKLNIGMDLARQAPDTFRRNAQLIRGGVNDKGKPVVPVPYVRVAANASDEDAHEALINHMTSNVLALHDAVPDDIRLGSAQWYDGAHEIARDIAQTHNIPHENAAGVLAALSPQKDWDMNVNLGRRVAHLAGNLPDDARMSTAMFDWVRRYADSKPEVADSPNTVIKQDVLDQLDKVARKRWGGMDNDDKAFFIRAYDEAHGPPSHLMVRDDQTGAALPKGFYINNPDGAHSGVVARYGPEYPNMAGQPRAVTWGSNDDIANALQAYYAPSMGHISEAMGVGHKVRSFFNNIIAPWSHALDVTGDTHAVGAALLRPLGASAQEVKYGLGLRGSAHAGTGVQGLYPDVAEAYRRAAAARGILPRQMQSITWEAARGLWNPVEKRSKQVASNVDQLWQAYKDGRLTQSQVQQQLLGAGGERIRPPRWHGSWNP